MIHEVMAFDHGGPAFGLILYGAAVKLFVLGALLMRIVVPFSTGNVFADWGVFLASMLGPAVVIGATGTAESEGRGPSAAPSSTVPAATGPGASVTSTG